MKILILRLKFFACFVHTEQLMTIAEKKERKRKEVKKKKKGRKKRKKVKKKKEERKRLTKKKGYHITAFPMSVQWCPVQKLFMCSVKGHKHGLKLCLTLLSKIPHFKPPKDVWKIPKQIIKQTIAKSTFNAAFKNKELYLTVFYFLFLIPVLSIDHVTWPTLFNELEGQCIQLPLSYYQDFNYPHTKIIGKMQKVLPCWI